MRRIVVATTNIGKIGEIRELLFAVAEVVAPDGLPVVVEDGTSLAENAYKKARSAADFLDIEAIAEDSGLFVAVLGGMPGVRSSRYFGPNATDAENRQKLLGALGDTTDRAAFFETVICLCGPGQPFEDAAFFSGRCYGEISFEERGEFGFGYDSIFIPTEGDGRTFAQMSSSEKSKYSHRAKAVRQFRDALF